MKSSLLLPAIRSQPWLSPVRQPWRKTTPIRLWSRSTQLRLVDLWRNFSSKSHRRCRTYHTRGHHESNATMKLLLQLSSVYSHQSQTCIKYATSLESMQSSLQTSKPQHVHYEYNQLLPCDIYCCWQRPSARCADRDIHW